MKMWLLWPLCRAPALNFTHWAYVDQEISRLDMEDVNFFDEAHRFLHQGDVITLSAKDGASIAWVSVDGEHIYLYPMSRTTK